MKKNKHEEIQEDIKNVPLVKSAPPVEDVQLDQSFPINRAYRFLKSRYDFRFNMITTELDYREKCEKKFRFLDNIAYHGIAFDLRSNGLNIKDNDITSILYSIHSKNYIGQKYNAFKDYLLKLPKWNEGDPDYIQQFLQQIQLPDEEDRDYLIRYFKKWFCSMIIALMDDEIDPFKVNQLAFILVGDQGKFKSTFLQRILPVEWREKYYYGSSFNFHNKDHELLLGTKILINLDELSSFNKTDIDLIKSKISLAMIEVRPPYGRFAIRLKRRASFCGSINHREFLRDETGNRRWFIVEISNIDLNFKDSDLWKIYSQAVAMIKSGFQYYANEEDIKEMDKHNEQFVEDTMEQDNVFNYFRIPTKQEYDDPETTILYLNSTEIANFLSTEIPKYNINGSVKRSIGRALAGKKHKRVSVRTDAGIVKKYPLVRITVNSAVPVDKNGNQIIDKNDVF